jgi:hypothetical protein
MTRFIDTNSYYAANIGKWTRFAWGSVANLRDRISIDRKPIKRRNRS